MLINHQTFDQDSLVSSNSSLYAYANGSLDRIDPATGTIAATAQYNPPLPNPPVIVGDTIWVEWSYSGGNGGQCIQVAAIPGHQDGPDPICAVRDSANPSGPALTFGHEQWQQFTAAVKTGSFGRS